MDIFVTVAKSVFGCCLRFADTAETIESLGLGQRSRSDSREPPVQQGQQVFATCEERIACMGKVPDPGLLRWWEQQTKFSRRFAKNLAESLAKIGGGKGRAVFPATDIDDCRADAVGEVLLRPSAL